MDRRSCERVPSNIVARFYSGDSPYTAIVTDCDEEGMCIKTFNCLPCGYNAEVHIPCDTGVLKVSATIVRIEKVDHVHYEIGVKVKTPPVPYLDFISHHRTAYHAMNDLLFRNMH